MDQESPQYVPGDESFAAYLRLIAGSEVELELVTGRVVTGRLSGVHNEWVMVIDAERKYTTAQVVHVASVRVLEAKKG